MPFERTPRSTPADPGETAAVHTSSAGRRGVTRRDLLKLLGAGAATVGAGAWLLDDETAGSPVSHARSRDTNAARRSPPAIQPVANVGVADRVLVMIELGGGNDGLSMVSPIGNGRFHDLRPSLAVGVGDGDGDGEPFPIDERWAWHPKLTRVAGRKAAVLQGVGSMQPDGSHFEMSNRWWQGSPDRSNIYDTGVLGRLADAIGDPDAAAVAISVSDGNHPIMLSRQAATLTLSDASATAYLTAPTPDDLMAQRFQRAYRSLGSGNSSEFEMRRQLVRSDTLRFADAVGVWDEASLLGYRDDRLGMGLRMAARLFDSGGIGLRIVHVTMDDGFDTHENHGWRYPELMAALDDNLGAFFDDLDARGIGDRVLVATMSEFGRTVGENGSGGLDHGEASNMLLFGPVVAGLHGEPPSFRGLEPEDGLPAAIAFDRYLATIAEDWFEVPADSVVDSGAKTISGVLR